MAYEIRPARPEEFALLPAIERSASRRFAAIVGLDDLPDDDELESQDIIASAARCGAGRSARKGFIRLNGLLHWPRRPDASR